VTAVNLVTTCKCKRRITDIICYTHHKLGRPGGLGVGYVNVEGGGSSRTVTRLHTMIGLTGYRTRDLLRIRRVLYRLTEKA
jgi:hypothetical protein